MKTFFYVKRGYLFICVQNIFISGVKKIYQKIVLKTKIDIIQNLGTIMEHCIVYK